MKHAFSATPTPSTRTISLDGRPMGSFIHLSYSLGMGGVTLNLALTEGVSWPIHGSTVVAERSGPSAAGCAAGSDTADDLIGSIGARSLCGERPRPRS